MMKYCTAIFICLMGLLNVNAQDLMVTFSKTDKECDLGKASVHVVQGHPPYHFYWSDGSGGEYISNLAAGDYSVKVTGDGGQDTTIHFTIEESICEPVAETHFTPNFDGYNDTWSISRLENFPNFELIVYNRWGQQVHHQFNTYIPWNGTSLGLALPDATYYYILFFDITDKNKFIKGDVSIIR
jgi:gliding motility-associated-like protein